jgi:ATP-dependent DNA helicase RecG
VATAVALLEAAWPEAAMVGGVPDTPLRPAVVHGQMKAAERDTTMERFRAGEVDVLIGTTVLEVGVDVPQATVMIVLDAERFGVAQLHQLRGRVGRGRWPSVCALVTDALPDPAIPDERLDDARLAVRKRLGAVSDTTDGFALAELDFQLRGEGKLLGLQQSGLPPLRVADLSTAGHRALSARAREQAESLVDEGGRLRPGLDALEAELVGGWLARVGAGDVLTADELDA